MVKYDFTEEQVNDMIAFFEWIGRMDLNGFPPEPTIGLAAAAPIAIPGGERPADLLSRFARRVTHWVASAAPSGPRSTV